MPASRRQADHLRCSGGGRSASSGGRGGRCSQRDGIRREYLTLFVRGCQEQNRPPSHTRFQYSILSRTASHLRLQRYMTCHARYIRDRPPKTCRSSCDRAGCGEIAVAGVVAMSCFETPTPWSPLYCETSPADECLTISHLRPPTPIHPRGWTAERLEGRFLFSIACCELNMSSKPDCHQKLDTSRLQT